MTKPTDRVGPSRPDLVTRVADIARALHMLWDGMGGAFREQLQDGRAVWRVYDQWDGFGGSAVLDIATEELLSIDETPARRDVSVVTLPPNQVPSEAELLAFARVQLAALNWPVPSTLAAGPGKVDKTWIVQSADAETKLSLEMEGGRRSLHLIRASRL
jgi:hypothetical protein